MPTIQNFPRTVNNSSLSIHGLSLMGVYSHFWHVLVMTFSSAHLKLVLNTQYTVWLCIAVNGGFFFLTELDWPWLAPYPMSTGVNLLRPVFDAGKLLQGFSGAFHPELGHSLVPWPNFSTPKHMVLVSVRDSPLMIVFQYIPIQCPYLCIVRLSSSLLVLYLDSEIAGKDNYIPTSGLTLKQVGVEN